MTPPHVSIPIVMFLNAVALTRHAGGLRVKLEPNITAACENVNGGPTTLHVRSIVHGQVINRHIRHLGSALSGPLCVCDNLTRT